MGRAVNRGPKSARGTDKSPLAKSKTGVSTIDEYLDEAEPSVAEMLGKLRAMIRSVAPDAEECISYRMPAFRIPGGILGGFAATRRGGSYYPFSGTTLSALARELQGYSQTQGALHFTAEAPLTKALVKKLIAQRRAEIAQGL